MIKRATLKNYRAKRNFKASPEPQGRVVRKPAARKPMFCVQKHLASHLHYDFRLEHHGVLLSWALPKGPSLNPDDKRLAVHVEDHPLDYGNFEGVIPSGYGAGIVMVWDSGHWTPEDADIDAALEAGKLKFELDGTKLKGSWVLVRMPHQEKNWLLIKHRDQWSGAVVIEAFAPASVKSGDEMLDILRRDERGAEALGKLKRGGEASRMLTQLIENVQIPRSKRRRLLTMDNADLRDSRE